MPSEIADPEEPTNAQGVDWAKRISAAAAVVALLLSGGSLAVAAEANRRSDRLEKTQKEAAQASHASQVVITGSTTSERRGDTPYTREVAFVFNYGDLPVEDLILLSPADDGTEYWTMVAGIGPCTKHTYTYPQTVGARFAKARIGFTDPNGRRWRRAQNQPPELVPRGARRTLDPDLMVQLHFSEAEEEPTATSSSRHVRYVTFKPIEGCSVGGS